MAKENYVSLYGQVISDIQLSSEKSGVFQKASFLLKVIRRFTDDYDNLEFASIPVLTGNPEMIKRIIKIKKGDMCDLKGVLTTINVQKTAFCSSCGAKILKPGMVSFVTPIFIQRAEALSEEYEDITNGSYNPIENKGLELLKEKNEISNIIHVIGTLCRDPEYYENPERPNKSNCAYQIAVNRHYHIKHGVPEGRTDFPWIRTYGELAKENKEVLSIKSSIYVNGSLSSKSTTVRIRCECNGEATYKDNGVLEIRPYSVEYLHNCNLPEKLLLE